VQGSARISREISRHRRKAPRHKAAPLNSSGIYCRNLSCGVTICLLPL
jgi:hypothetical protein